jgi:hypothetical protein
MHYLRIIAVGVVPNAIRDALCLVFASGKGLRPAMASDGPVEAKYDGRRVKEDGEGGGGIGAPGLRVLARVEAALCGRISTLPS